MTAAVIILGLVIDPRRPIIWQSFPQHLTLIITGAAIYFVVSMDFRKLLGEVEILLVHGINKRLGGV